MLTKSVIKSILKFFDLFAKFPIVKTESLPILQGT